MSVNGRQGNIESSKGVARVLLSGVTYTEALTMPAVLAEPTETDATIGLGLVDTGKNNRVRFYFAGTAAENKTINYQVIGLMGSRDGDGQGWIPEKIAAGVATTGTKAVGTPGAFIEAAGSLFADTITETTSHAGTVTYSPADDAVASLTVDVSMFQYVYIQVDLGDAASADVIAAVFSAAA